MNSFCLILAIFIAGTVCDDTKCDDETKSAFSITFCDEATHCANETAEKFLDDFRHCFIKASTLAKEIIERSEKLPVDQCLEEVSKGTCDIITDIGKHPEQYTECIKDIEQMPSLLESCINTDSTQSRDLEDLARLVCADPEKVKCDSNDAMEAYKVGKKCVVDNSDDLRDIRKNNPDLEKCKTQAKEDFVKLTQDQTKFTAVHECMQAHKQLLHDSDPTKLCDGI